MLIDWLLQSPDLNIKEHMWCLMKEKVSKRYAKNADELWLAIKKEWDSISKETVEGLYRSIPKRLKVTLRNKGLYSHY